MGRASSPAGGHTSYARKANPGLQPAPSVVKRPRQQRIPARRPTTDGGGEPLTGEDTRPTVAPPVPASGAGHAVAGREVCESHAQIADRGRHVDRRSGVI